MSFSILSSVPTLVLSKSMPVIICQCTAGINVYLKKNNVLVLSELYYPDANGNVQIDYSEVIDSLLWVSIPDANIMEQQDAVASFTIILDDTQDNFIVAFTAVKGILPENYLSATEFLDANFLTSQPQALLVKYYDPQFLSYYASQNVKLMLGIKSSAGYRSVVMSNVQGGYFYSFNVQFNYLRATFCQPLERPVYFDLWVIKTNTTGDRLSFVQRYVLQNDYDSFDDLYLFENPFSGIDIIRFNGQVETRGDHQVESALFLKSYQEYDIEKKTVYAKSTGYLKNDAYTLWAKQFFESIFRFHYVNGSPKRIIVSKFEDKSIPGQLNDFSFEYYYSETDKVYLAKRSAEPLPEDSIEFTEAPKNPDFSDAFNHDFNSDFPSQDNLNNYGF